MFFTGIECISSSIANSDSITAKTKLASDKMINFNRDLSFEMMVILNFVVLTIKKITGCLRGIHVLGKIWPSSSEIVQVK